MLLLDKPQKAPFTLLFSEKTDPSLYSDEIKDSQKLVDTNNHETQTSDFSINAGTTLTYDYTCCGYGLGTKQDDNEQTDT